MYSTFKCSPKSKLIILAEPSGAVDAAVSGLGAVRIVTLLSGSYLYGLQSLNATIFIGLSLMGFLYNNGRVCLAYSAGGHYAELEKALSGLSFSDVYHITFDSGRFSKNQTCERYFLIHPQKKVGRTLINALQSFILLLKKRPKIIISTGADVTVATIVLGKLLLRSKVVFIESAGDITPTLTGRIVYRFCDLFIVQWPDQLKYYPRAILSDGVLL